MSLTAAGAGIASAAAVHAAAVRPAGSTTVCGGTAAAPDFLNDQTFDNVAIDGFCQVSAGPVLITGNLTLDATTYPSASPSVLQATYALTVDGNVSVQRGAVLLLGCEPTTSPCWDDPTLTMQPHVGGEITATDALGLSVNDATIAKSVVVSGGAGGAGCVPTGAFIALGSPDSVLIRDDTIGGSVTIAGVQTCRLSVIGNRVAGDAGYTANLAADAASGEVTQNVVLGDLACTGNRPAVQFGPSGTLPDVVGGNASGQCSFTSRSPDPALDGGGTEPVSIPSQLSLWLADLAGAVDAIGEAQGYGGVSTGSPVVAVVPTTDAGGYWLATADGAAQARGDASYRGSMAGRQLHAPIVGMAATAGGYWLAGADGGVFAFGGARYLGSLGATHLSAPIVGIAATPDGRGYWLVGADGGVFAFGDARYLGSLGRTHLDAPIVGIAATPGGRGYWLLGRDGGVFAFGDAGFAGSLAGRDTVASVSLLSGPGGLGYWLVDAHGDVSAFGVVRDVVSLPEAPPHLSVSAVALLP
jgi:hypothetical protein